MVIYLGRHGETTLNKQRLMRGWSDVPLSSKGKEEAQELGKKLKRILPKPPEEIYSSDLKRAQQCAQIVSTITGGKIKPEKALRTWDVGFLEGVQEDAAFELLDLYAERQPDIAVPEGESFSSFSKRFLNLLKRCLKHGSNNTVFITHFRDLCLAQAYIDGLKDGKIDMSTFLNHDDSDTGSLMKIYGNGDSWKWSMV